MKKCVIIGSQGYIGKHLTWYLNKIGHDVVGYDIMEEDQKRRIDMTNKEAVSKIDFNVDIIFMFTGLTGTYGGFDNYDKYIDVNERTLLNLLDAIRHSEYRPKVVFPSTRLVYKGKDKPLKENDLKESKTIYAVNKIACEGYLDAYYRSFDIPYTVFRICIPYGNFLGTDYSFGTVGFFIKMASTGENITLYGGGDIKRTFTYMEDLCYQIANGAFIEESIGNIYNVGGETFTLKEVAELVAKKYGVNVVTVPWPEKDLKIESNHTYFDDTKIQNLLKNYHYKSIKEFL